jgi:hypothetical protein
MRQMLQPVSAQEGFLRLNQLKIPNYIAYIFRLSQKKKKKQVFALTLSIAYNAVDQTKTNCLPYSIIAVFIVFSV